MKVSQSPTPITQIYVVKDIRTESVIIVNDRVCTTGMVYQNVNVFHVNRSEMVTGNAPYAKRSDESSLGASCDLLPSSCQAQRGD